MSTQAERDAHQRGWSEGFKAYAKRMVQEALPHLGAADKDAAAWQLERAEAVAMLRQVCKEHGDNDWPDDLHLADVIEKHLWRNLPEPVE